jgi:hypothetical protein
MEAVFASLARPVLRSVAAMLACAGLLLTAGCAGVAGPTCGTGAGAGNCTRILFLGNSYTYVNDLPSTFARLAQSGGHPVYVDSIANGGETLAQHAVSADDLSKIASQHWSYVVLQEQSDTPATDAGRASMYSAARTLAARVESAAAMPIFFMTWAHKDGEPSAGQNYETMQQQVDGAYLTISRELGVPVAPVGYTWYMVRRDHPDIDMWQSDGSHPTQAGTYLAACVFYAAFFRQSPAKLGFHGGVSDEQARLLQDEAGSRVLDMKSEWGLG